MHCGLCESKFFLQFKHYKVVHVVLNTNEKVKIDSFNHFRYLISILKKIFMGWFSTNSAIIHLWNDCNFHLSQNYRNQQKLFKIKKLTYWIPSTFSVNDIQVLGHSIGFWSILKSETFMSDNLFLHWIGQRKVVLQN